MTDLTQRIREKTIFDSYTPEESLCYYKNTRPGQGNESESERLKCEKCMGHNYECPNYIARKDMFKYMKGLKKSR